MRKSRSTLFPLLGRLPCFVALLALLADSAFADEQPATLTPEALAQAQAQRASYQAAVTQLETRQGVYGTELSEAYMGLGTTLRTLQLHDEAAEAFGKALQSLRISQGLNDIRQLPVLQDLRATNETLQNWDEVHAANYLMFHIAKHNTAASEELRVNTLLQLGNWIRKADAESLVSDFDANVDDLTRLYNTAIARLETLSPYPGKGVHLASLYLDLAATELGEAKRKYELPISAFQTPGAGEQRTTTTQSCFSAVDRSGRTVVACTTPMEVPNINYYLAPNVQKSTEIRAHLAEVENKVLAAFNTLQDEPATTDLQTTLLAEVRRLTSEYNDFVAINRE